MWLMKGAMCECILNIIEHFMHLHWKYNDLLYTHVQVRVIAAFISYNAQKYHKVDTAIQTSIHEHEQLAIRHSTCHRAKYDIVRATLHTLNLSSHSWS